MKKIMIMMFIMLCGSNAYAFSYADVVAEAERLASSAYVEDTTPLPHGHDSTTDWALPYRIQHIAYRCSV